MLSLHTQSILKYIYDIYHNVFISPLRLMSPVLMKHVSVDVISPYISWSQLGDLFFENLHIYKIFHHQLYEGCLSQSEKKVETVSENTNYIIFFISFDTGFFKSHMTSNIL